MEITIPNDFKELIELLDSHKVEYINNKKALGRQKDLAGAEVLEKGQP